MTDPLTRLSAALEGRYAVERELGEGGMAVVYLAGDLRHGRKVALKVLKPELAAVVGSERFLTEIETTANLHHPNILPLFDSGEANGFLFYVMPYVDGETLRERLDRDHQLPVDEAVRVASAVAQALQHAHERGVIHRDIKPANILLQDGQPVVSDFGIALAVGAAGGTRLTETGLSVGTPFYMSPEQATGDQQVGPASDTYALAAVLYEMLVGDPPYIGSTAQAVLGKIIQGEPVSATATRRSVPANVDAAIRKALEKLPADRFASTKDFARALADPGFRHGGDGGRPVAAGPWRRVAIAAVAVAVLALGIAAAAVSSSRSEPARSVVRFTVPLGDGAERWLGGVGALDGDRPSVPSVALSPDGTVLVYAAWDTASDGSARSRLYRRRLEQEQAEPIPDTEGAANPFFSPGGEWIAFVSGGALRRVPSSGGAAETIVSDVAAPGLWRGASWSDDGTIAFVRDDGVHVLAASGGQPRLFIPESIDDRSFALPHFLPGGRALLFNAWGAGGPTRVELSAFDRDTGERMSLLRDAMNPLYLTTGHLLFLRRGTLMAVEFDAERVEVTGEPFLVLEDVMQALAMPLSSGETGAAQVAVSADGDLVYASGGVYPARRHELVRVRADGSEEPLDLPPAPYLHVRASPTGERIAYNVEDFRALSISVFDLGRGVTQSLATGGYFSGQPSWNADGTSVAFQMETADGERGIYSMTPDGRDEPERLGEGIGSVHSWSDGAIVYDYGGDLWVIPSDGGEPHTFFASDARETYATFSPDGRWLAYVTSETGRSEVYVRPYPGPDPPTRITTDGGTSPAWSSDGARLYFEGPTATGRALMVADLTTEPELGVERTQMLIDPWNYRSTGPVRSYDVLPDGSFVAIRAPDEADLRVRGRELHVVLGFAEQLRRRGGR